MVKTVSFAAFATTRTYKLDFVDGILPQNGCGFGFVGAPVAETLEPLRVHSKPKPRWLATFTDKRNHVYENGTVPCNRLRYIKYLEKMTMDDRLTRKTTRQSSENPVVWAREPRRARLSKAEIRRHEIEMYEKRYAHEPNTITAGDSRELGEIAENFLTFIKAVNKPNKRKATEDLMERPMKRIRTK